MTSSWEGEAPAKVNLFLRVLAREVSGFHHIETLFQTLRLSDGIRLETRDSPETTLSVEGVPEGELGPSAENLAVQGARAVAEELARRGIPAPGVAIRLEKRIPHGAGLGGGSSDAASVMIGLNEMMGSPIPRADLLSLGSTLGSDVPFFLARTPLSLAWGRGDRLFPLPALPERPVLLAVPTEGVSTSWAYGQLALHREREPAPRRGALLTREELDSWNAIASGSENDFEAALFPVLPEIARLRAEMQRVGGAPALLSGSGSVVFGVFEDEEAAARGEARLRADLPSVALIRTRTRAS